MKKFKLALDFSSLPYLSGEAHRLIQGNAILRYIARRYNLCGQREEKIHMDILENKVLNIRMSLVRVCYGPDSETEA